MRIYVLTYRRVNHQTTVKGLTEELLPMVTVVVHESEEEELRAVLPAGVGILVHDVVGGSAVREFILDHHRKNEEDPRFLMLDDDLAFDIRQGDQIVRFDKLDEDDRVEAFLDLVDDLRRALAVYPLAGVLPTVFANRRDPSVRWYINTRMYACWGVNVRMIDAAGVKFNRVSYADDFDVMMQVLEAGMDFVGINWMTIVEVSLPKKVNPGGEWTMDRLAGVVKKIDAYERLRELHPEKVTWHIKKGVDPDEIEAKDVKIRINWKRFERPRGPLEE